MTGAGSPDRGQARPPGILPVATHLIGSDEWLLLVPPARAHPELLKRAALSWLDTAKPSAGGSAEFVPAPVDPALGLAVLHHRPGENDVYCREQDLALPGAETLSLITITATPVLLAAAPGTASRNPGSPRSATTHGSAYPPASTRTQPCTR